MSAKMYIIAEFGIRHRMCSHIHFIVSVIVETLQLVVDRAAQTSVQRKAAVQNGIILGSIAESYKSNHLIKYKSA